MKNKLVEKKEGIVSRLNIFIENIYSEFKVNEKVFDDSKVLNGTKKILKYFLDTEEVFSKSCLKGYDYETLSFDIVFCDNEKIHEINREYRNKDMPTDVITFALFADSAPEERFIFDEEINLGEILISLDKTLEQAQVNGHSFSQELFFLISHGIMHLLGFDHLSEKELEYMLEQQQKSMEKVNVKIFA